MSERIRAQRSPSSLDRENTNGILEANDLLLKEGVCEPSASTIDVTVPLEVPSPPAHPLNRLTTQLNSFTLFVVLGLTTVLSVKSWATSCAEEAGNCPASSIGVSVQEPFSDWYPFSLRNNSKCPVCFSYNACDDVGPPLPGGCIAKGEL